MAEEPPRKLQPAVFTTVAQLSPQTHGHNLVVKVVNKSVVVEKVRTDNSKIRIAECLVGDATASVVMTARNEQIDVLQPGKAVIIRNSKVDMFKGFMRLAVDKWGKIEIAKEPVTFEANTNTNVSSIEYELITLE